jgi:hypothetical protein
MRKFMLIAVSVVLTMFLASEARAQQVNYNYTYYTNGNSYVCAIRAPFGEVHILHSHPVSTHTCRDHYSFFVRTNYPVKLFHVSNGIYYTHWDTVLRYNTDYLSMHQLTPHRYYHYRPHRAPSVTFQWNGRILPRTTIRTYDYRPPVRRHNYNPPVRRYTAPERQRRTTVTYGTTRTSRPPQERRTVRSETTTRRRTTTSNNNSNRRRSRDGNRERRRR